MKTTEMKFTYLFYSVVLFVEWCVQPWVVTATRSVSLFFLNVFMHLGCLSNFPSKNWRQGFVCCVSKGLHFHFKYPSCCTFCPRCCFFCRSQHIPRFWILVLAELEILCPLCQSAMLLCCRRACATGAQEVQLLVSFALYEFGMFF